MKKLDQSYWENRYVNHDTPWQLESVSSPLKWVIDELEDKNQRILIPGGGNSQEAKYLLENGFTNVTVVDLSYSAINKLSTEVGHNEQLTLIQDDFFNLGGTYDLILEQTFFCALEIRFRESYVSKTHDLLSEKGSLRGVLFNFEKKKDSPPYGGSIHEYQNLFSDHFHIKSLQPCTISEPSRQGKELLIHFQK